MISSKTLLITTAERKRSNRFIVAVVVPLITFSAIVIALVLGPFKHVFHNPSSNTISSPIRETPKSQGKLCVNSETFRYLHDGKLRTCRNIRIREDRRQKLCLIESVNEACPQTCGRCCQDLIDYTFTRFNGYPGTCNWLRQKRLRINKYCNYIDKSFNGRTVRDGCPVTCNLCFSNIEIGSSKPTISPPPTKMVSAEPSKSPTDRPSSPPSPFPSTSRPTLKPSISPSDFPSQYPSDKLSLKPSEFPSNKPSLKPSQYPSSKPSEFPSNKPSSEPSQYPSLKPSQFPSDLPSLKPSEFPSDLPSKEPSQYPSLKPSHFPSDPPSLKPTVSNSPTFSPAPSSAPSIVPSAVPSVVPSLSPSIGCSDDDEFLIDGDPNRPCSWLTKNSDKRDIRIAAKCPLPLNRYKCMKSCDACSEECADNDDLTFPLNSGGDGGDCYYIWRNLNKKKI